MKTYLDYNATAPIRPAAAEQTIQAMQDYGNPSSIHHFGREARRKVENAREQLARYIRCRPANIIFTSSATEANNTILNGLPSFKKLLVSAVEHPSVLNVRPDATTLNVLSNGLLDIDDLAEKLQALATPCLVSVQMVNSETGIIQPIKDIVALCRKYDTRIHSDAVQALGRIPISMPILDLDYMSFTAHKIGGGMGAGALVAADLRPFEPFIKGGGQERRRRAGTENMPAIVGFGAAANILSQDSDYQEMQHLRHLQHIFENGIRTICPDAVIVGADVERVANTSLIIFRGMNAETLLMNFDLENVAISTGSACSSGSVQPSHVLKAMGYDDNDARSALRFSTGWQSTENDIHHALNILEKIIKRNAA